MTNTWHRVLLCQPERETDLQVMGGALSRHIIQNRWFDSITFRYPVPSAQRSFAFSAAVSSTVLVPQRHFAVESDQGSLLLRRPAYSI